MATDYSTLYLDPTVRYVRRTPFASALVSGDPDLTKGDKKKVQNTPPTAKSIAYTYADDIVLLLGLVLVGGYMRSGKPFSKIVGKIPGWASSVVGVATGSDFVAGNSYLPRSGSPGWDGAFSIVQANKIRGIIGSTIIAGSVLLGGSAHATIAQDASKLRGDISSIEAVYDKDVGVRTNASNALYETAVHESGLLKYNKQVGGGPAVSKFQIEPVTAKNLVAWAKRRNRAINLLEKESGFSYKHLSMMSKEELAENIIRNQKFAASVARLKYASSPGKIPSTIEGRAHYYSKYYQGTDNPIKEKQYISDNRKMAEEIKASSVSKVISRHTPGPPSTHGIVQWLDRTKIGHNISSIAKKLAMRGL